ncbi:MAG TPA: DUF3341 domain-containing protein [Vicinamibacterales bacterium]|nr:DUF3341 domain-containing protein [Vicinamibacterales bacterium]
MADVRTTPVAPWGLLAEFDDVNVAVDAARRVYAEGYRNIDAYSPFPVEPLWEAIGANDKRPQLFTLLGGIAGALGGFGLCYWVSAIAYPLNIGGRPLNSWPAFIPITFETTILIASFSALLSMIVLNGLPMPYHPVFNVPSFASTGSTSSFFISVEATDAKFDLRRTRDFLAGLGAKAVHEVQP